MGFERLVSEHGIYAPGEGSDRIFLALCVDDLLIVRNNKEVSAEFKDRLKEHYKVKYMVVLSSSLG